MIPVSIEGVRRNFTTSSIFMYSAPLLDASGQHTFTFNIDRQEALSIATALHDLPIPRPQTINMMVDTLKLLDSTLEEVRVEHFSMLPPLYLESATMSENNTKINEPAERIIYATCLDLRYPREQNSARSSSGRHRRNRAYHLPG